MAEIDWSSDPFLGSGVDLSDILPVDPIPALAEDFELDFMPPAQGENDNGKEIYLLQVPISCPPEDDARKIDNITTTFHWSGGEFGGKIGGIRRHKPRDWNY